MENNIVIFKDGDVNVEVKVSPEQDTVWLTQKQMSVLFGVTTDNISLHIKNILEDGELENSTVEESSVVQREGKRNSSKKIRRKKKYNK